MSKTDIERLIAVDDIDALGAAYLQIQSEVGCQLPENHPLYLAWKSKAMGLKNLPKPELATPI